MSECVIPGTVASDNGEGISPLASNQLGQPRFGWHPSRASALRASRSHLGRSVAEWVQLHIISPLAADMSFGGVILRPGFDNGVLAMGGAGGLHCVISARTKVQMLTCHVLSVKQSVE